MTYNPDPPRWPTRTHTQAIVVRWRYPHWTRDCDGLYRWRTRWLVNRPAARRLINELRDSGAVVHHDVYALDHVMRIDDVAGTAHTADELGDR